MAKKNKNRPATKEQIDEINKGLKQIGIGDSLEDFAKKYGTQEYRETFAKSLSKSLKSLSRLSQLDTHNGSYQAVLSQNMFQDININPRVASSEELEGWLTQPSKYDSELRSLSQYLNYAVGQYNSLLWITSTSKAFNYVMLPAEPDIKKEVKTKDYKESYESACNILRKLNLKSQLAKVDLQVTFDGVAFYYIYETTEEITLYQLPTEYCYIVAPWAYGYRFAFDLTYFNDYVSIGGIAFPELKEAYERLVKAREDGIDGKDLASIQYYVFEPNKGWCFTFDPIHPDKVPPFAGAMLSALDVLSYRQLIKDKAIFELYKVLALKIPLQKDNQKMSITYEEAAAIRNVIQAQLPSNVTCYASPFDSEAIDTEQIDDLDDLIKLGSNSFSSSSGLNEALFGGGDMKQATALQFCYQVFFQRTSKNMYRQYENFINWMLRKECGTKFKIQMFGSTARPQDDINMYSNIVKNNNCGVEFLFAAMGMEPFSTLSMLQLDDELGYRDLMIPIQSMFQSSGSNLETKGDPGRPKKNDSDLAESGERSRDYESSEN